MKRFKSGIILLICIVCCLLTAIAAACGETEPPSNQLSAPQNLRIVNSKLIWDKVENATAYTVSFYGSDNQTNKTYYDLYIASEESVTFEVCALGNGENYTDSEKTSFSSRVSSANLTAGLTYTLTSDKTGYAVSGKNANLSGKIVIADYYAGLPVKVIAQSAFLRTTGGNTSIGGLQVTTPITPTDNENLTGVRLPATLETIEYEAFSRCVALTEIEIPEGVKTIEGSSFQNNTNLKTVKLPATLEIIKSLAFSGCSKLRTINFPASLQKIEAFAFSGCTALINPSIPDSVDVHEWAFL